MRRRRAAVFICEMSAQNCSWLRLSYTCSFAKRITGMGHHLHKRCRQRHYRMLETLESRVLLDGGPITFGAIEGTPAPAAPTLVPMILRTDFIFDPLRQRLYLPSISNSVGR